MRGRRYRSGMRWCLWRWTDVDVDDKLYLRRLHLFQTPLFSIMLHWIMRPDPQPDLHDHPVAFASIVLRGGYAEEVPGARLRWIKHLNLKLPTHRHRIRWAAPNTLTLVFAGPVVRKWGFWRGDQFIPWREYGTE